MSLKQELATMPLDDAVSGVRDILEFIQNSNEDSRANFIEEVAEDYNPLVQLARLIPSIAIEEGIAQEGDRENLEKGAHLMIIALRGIAEMQELREHILAAEITPPHEV